MKFKKEYKHSQDMCPHEDSNLDHKLRKLVFYPLNYEG